MKLTEWKLSFLRGVDRLVRASFAFKMRLTLVIVISTVMVLSLFSHTDCRLAGPRRLVVAEGQHDVLQANLTQLKDAIKSIRQQKRNIIRRQLVSKESIRQRPNLTDIELPPKTKSAPTSTTSSSNQSPNHNENDLSNYIENGIFWSRKVESLVPKGFSPEDDVEWLSLLRHSSVVNVSTGCGRMQNRLISLDNGAKLCVRYRKNNDQIQGEFVSFLLARILQIGNVPPTALVPNVFQEPLHSGLQWHSVQSNLKQAQWEAKPVVLTKFVEDLEPAFIPRQLRTKSHRRLQPVLEDFEQLSRSDLTELVQWSDLIVFDFLTANLDRMINNLINERWNAQMMDSPAHNLLRLKSSLLLFVDNESGLFHGYRLLKKFDSLHRSLLKMLCVFRQSTVTQLEMVARLTESEFAALLRQHHQKYMLTEPGSPSEDAAAATILPKVNLHLLRERLNLVLQQVRHCQSRFSYMR